MFSTNTQAPSWSSPLATNPFSTANKPQNNIGFGTQTTQPNTTVFSGFQIPSSSSSTVIQPPVENCTQLLQCLNESKTIQQAILLEMQNISKRISNDQLQVQHQPFISQQTITKHVHSGVHCDACKTMNIQGCRFKCLFCKDYDLCETCECNHSMYHDPSHSFIKIKDTINFNTMIQVKSPFSCVP